MENNIKKCKCVKSSRVNTRVENEKDVIREFARRGIPVHAIMPRENVLTFSAWRKQGRRVCRGERGVPVKTFVAVYPKNDAVGISKTSMSPKTVLVFHISQTTQDI